MILWLAWLGCATVGQGSVDADLSPASLHQAECAVCGMVVAEQPAPRGQLVYRDGTHHHVCSVEELRAQAQQRSPLGQPVALYVEVLPDPAAELTAEQPWVPVEEASFVFGADRPFVMGRPVLAFDDSLAADAAARALGTTAVPWDDLYTTPFPEIPARALTGPR